MAKRHQDLNKGEVLCPLCGSNPVVKVGVWEPEPLGKVPVYGLGFETPDGVICCSFFDGHRFLSREEAEEEIAKRSFHDWCVEKDHSYMQDQEDLIGDQDDGDPYDRERPIF